jgi:hypothetical protein
MYRERWCQTSDESLQQRIRVLETDPSITIRSAVVEAVKGALHIGLAVVRGVQSLVLAPNSLNRLVAEGVVIAPEWGIFHPQAARHNTRKRKGETLVKPWYDFRNSSLHLQLC